MTIDADDLLTEMTESSRGTLVERMGIELVEVTPERVVARMPVAGNTQPYGLLHGGASAVLAETIGSICAALHAGPDRVAVGVDLNATHHRAVRDGWVVGVATPLVAGRSAASLEIVVSTEDGRRVCTSRLTCMLRDRVPGS
ncbi:hotdog fold thioesterase [Nostocoides sp. F2B08]|uniref:hotdog fold thioesterase n=1 Tax=Nostocoides sp. F2B08 TaxID=2653936 RepID=UPI0012638610|nr:hotdog fold thioesterase [Tetrasphaera sp. F2B08]KAB7744568.1 hotdog fold thioesterase [Tetrasphaera sp. F2B08]